MEKAPVEVDVIGMRRVLDSLIENAVKYGHQARVRLFTDGPDAVVEIGDRGPGLPVGAAAQRPWGPARPRTFARCAVERVQYSKSRLLSLADVVLTGWIGPGRDGSTTGYSRPQPGIRTSSPNSMRSALSVNAALDELTTLIGQDIAMEGVWKMTLALETGEWSIVRRKAKNALVRAP